jgi:hypothetical protein
VASGAPCPGSSGGAAPPDTAPMQQPPPRDPARPVPLPPPGPPGVGLILSGPVMESRSAADDEERADPGVVARAEARGELVRIRAGVHVDRRAWEAVSARDRHLLRIRALRRATSAPVVLGGASAAAVHGLPRLASWPALVTLLDVPGLPPGRRAGTRVQRDPARGRSPLLLLADGIRLPGLAATALAACHDAAMDAVRSAAPGGPGWLAHGLVPLDHALSPARPAPATRGDLEAERALRGPGPWSRRGAFLVTAADGASGSAVESIARGVALELGLPHPDAGAMVEGHGRLALAWRRERVGVRVLGAVPPPALRAGVGAGTRPDRAEASATGGSRWRVMEVGERDVRAPGRLRALLLHAGLEPESRGVRAAPGARRPPDGERSRRSSPLGCASE